MFRGCLTTSKTIISCGSELILVCPGISVRVSVLVCPSWTLSGLQPPPQQKYFLTWTLSDLDIVWFRHYPGYPPYWQKKYSTWTLSDLDIVLVTPPPPAKNFSTQTLSDLDIVWVTLSPPANTSQLRHCLSQTLSRLPPSPTHRKCSTWTMPNLEMG